jgi:hypothetical protein
VTDDFLYGYNADSDVLTRNNALNSSFNEQYGYDNLNRLTSFTGPGGLQDRVLGAWLHRETKPVNGRSGSPPCARRRGGSEADEAATS